MPDPSPLLLTGATGFIGGALLDRLRDRRPVRCLVRDRSRLADEAGVEVVEGDLADGDALREALDGVGTATYLVHSMEAGSGGFAQRDRELAEGFVAAAGDAGVRRLVYLGGVQPADGGSEHLSSREEVAEVLGGGAPELVELRASMVVGAGSDSFRTLAQLVERLPVLALPSWRDRRTQPVAVDDVVAALVAATDPERVPAGAYDLAGPDTLSFQEIAEQIARLLGKTPRPIPLPASSSRLEAAVSSVVADADYELLQPLFAGLHEDLLVADNALPTTFGVRPTPFAEAAEAALAAMGVLATAP